MFASRVKGPKSLIKQQGMNGVLLSFLLGLVVSFAIFLPFLIVDKGFFTYCGDFNEQQIPFYMYVQGFIKSGGGQWSWATDLGGSIVNSYSFYNLGSPFLWLSMLVPNSWMPFMMVPLLCLKFGCISAAASLYLSRYAKTRNMVVVVSLVYAFCGFNVYNVFFNHMLEPVVIFPLMLWALDSFVYDGRRGLFAIFVGLSLINSYFFFLGNVVFVLLYFIVKLACGEYTLNGKTFGILVFEAVLGVGLGMVLALPSFLNLIGNPRTENFANGFGMVLYGNVQQYWNIITSMFLPPDPPYLPNLFTEGAIKWTSMSAFLPIVGMGGVIAYCKNRRGGSVKKLLFISLVMALVPFLNSSFYAFNASYYARWYYMPMLMMCLATLRALEDDDIDLAGGARWALILTGVYAVFGLLPVKTDGVWTLGVAQDARKFWLTFLTAIFASLLFFILVRIYRRRGGRLAPALLAAVMGFSVFYSVIHISLGKFPQWERDATYRERQYDSAYRLELPNDNGFYRIDTFNAHDNLGLWLNRSSIRTFNSTVTPSIMEFYPFVGVKRDVSSKPEPELYALRGLLSVRYTLVPKEETSAFLSSAGSAGWRYWTSDDAFDIFENDNFVPLGFTYDEFVRLADLESVRAEDRGALLLRGIGLSAEQVGRFSHLFEGQALQWTQAQTQQKTQGETGGGWYNYDPVTYERYEQDAAQRRASASYESSYDASGFSVKIAMEKENLVFFAVPYDEGFTATVNGEAAEVLKVSGGLMAVRAPAGDNTIAFTYNTPGFWNGTVVTLVTLGVLIAYLLLCWHLRRRRVLKAAALPEEEAVDAVATAGELLVELDFDVLAAPEPPKRDSHEPADETQRLERAQPAAYAAPMKSPAEQPEKETTTAAPDKDTADKPAAPSLEEKIIPPPKPANGAEKAADTGKNSDEADGPAG